MGVLLGARARLKGGAAAGCDGLVAEMLKAMPWECIDIEKAAPRFAEKLVRTVDRQNACYSTMWRYSWKIAVACYEFQKSHKVHHMTAPLLHMTRHATLWGKSESIHMGIMDTKKAFDHATVSMVIRAMEYFKYPVDLTTAIV
eukprot:7941855-Pyramimonas_sp.AAC.1